MLERGIGGGIELAGIGRATVGYLAAGALAGGAAVATTALLAGRASATGFAGELLTLGLASAVALTVFMLGSLALGLPEARRALELGRLALAPVGRRLRSASLR